MHFSIQALVKEIKEEMLLDIDSYSFVSPSADDTAWTAMIDPLDSGQPWLSSVFKDCLDWVLNNQTEEGYWGECDAHGNPTIEPLPATLACAFALKKRNVGNQNIKRGLDFVQGNAEKLIGVTYDHFPRWFTIVFSGMIEVAHEVGLELAFPSQLNGLLLDIFHKRKRILET